MGFQQAMVGSRGARSERIVRCRRLLSKENQVNRESAEHFAVERSRDGRRAVAVSRHSRRARAMLEIPREEFASKSFATKLTDKPLRIGYGQTISLPYITARMD